MFQSFCDLRGASTIPLPRRHLNHRAMKIITSNLRGSRPRDNTSYKLLRHAPHIQVPRLPVQINDAKLVYIRGRNLSHYTCITWSHFFSTSNVIKPLKQSIGQSLTRCATAFRNRIADFTIVTPYKKHIVSYHWHFRRFVQQLVMDNNIKRQHQSSVSLTLCEENHTRKRSVMWKAFLCHDISVPFVELTAGW